MTVKWTWWKKTPYGFTGKSWIETDPEKGEQDMKTKTKKKKASIKKTTSKMKKMTTKV